MKRRTISDKLEGMLAQLDTRYDAEHDAGPVTWADADLMQAVLELAAELDELHIRLTNLENRL